jgi:ubiquinol-cytochrome c reductase cytochrome b subunit
VFERFLAWINQRTDYRRLLLPLRRRTLPGGPRWEYSTASCLLWLLVVQAVTGFLLMATYSPSTNSAWASVHYIEESPSGSFIRGLHYYASHGLIILFAIHTIRVLLQAGFRPPRELIWITGLFLAPLMLLWAITGNPLAATVKGMAQIEVEGSIIGSTPIIGPIVQRILIGGDEVGHLTLTHLYFLHVALLPLLLGGLLVIHIGQVYRYGLSPPYQTPVATAVPYWPFQTIRNVTVFAAVLGIVAALAWLRKAPLEAPADALLPHTPRPEWYLLFLFELRRYFTGQWEFVATVLLPAAALLLLLAMPLLDRHLSARAGRRLRIGVVLAGVLGWAGLTGVSALRDRQDEEFQAAQAQSEEFSRRAHMLADRGEIPPEGGVALLRHDPATQGPLLFAQHCASCHSHADEWGKGIVAEESSAPNLYGFASREWLVGLLDPERIATGHYFGKTKFADGDMVGALKEHFDSADTSEAKAELRAKLKKVAWALSAEAGLPQQAQLDRQDSVAIAEGTKLLTGDLSCTDCHRFRGQGEPDTAPDLTGYGSKTWLLGMIGDPQGQRFYPGDRNDRMPAFVEDRTHPESNLLTAHELEMLVSWLRGDWYRAPVDRPRPGL